VTVQWWPTVMSVGPYSRRVSKGVSRVYQFGGRVSRKVAHRGISKAALARNPTSSGARSRPNGID
jgi:hypothetical protein